MAVEKNTFGLKVGEYEILDLLARSLSFASTHARFLCELKDQNPDPALLDEVVQAMGYQLETAIKQLRTLDRQHIRPEQSSAQPSISSSEQKRGVAGFPIDSEHAAKVLVIGLTQTEQEQITQLEECGVNLVFVNEPFQGLGMALTLKPAAILCADGSEKQVDALNFFSKLERDGAFNGCAFVVLHRDPLDSKLREADESLAVDGLWRFSDPVQHLQTTLECALGRLGRDQAPGLWAEDQNLQRSVLILLAQFAEPLQRLNSILQGFATEIQNERQARMLTGLQGKLKEYSQLLAGIRQTIYLGFSKPLSKAG